MNCPHCKTELNKTITRRISAVPEFAGGIETVSCIAYICASCKGVISIQADPVSEASQIRILRAEFKELKARLDRDFEKLLKRFAVVGQLLHPENKK